jgi:hypothetical protein
MGRAAMPRTTKDLNWVQSDARPYADTQGGNQPVDKSMINRGLKRSIPGSVQSLSSEIRPHLECWAGELLLRP